VRTNICVRWRGWRELGRYGEGRVKDKAGRGGKGGTISLRVGLGMGIAVGTSSFAVDWC
jgi:hypothetical protein